MKVLLPFSTIILLFTTFTNAIVISDSHLASSCIYFLRELPWNCTNLGGHMSSSTWTCQCLNDDWLGSITNCIYDYKNSTKEMTHAYHHIVERCNVRAKTNYNVTFLSDYQKNTQDKLIPVTPFLNGSSITGPVSIDDATFDYFYKSFKDYNIFIAMCQRLGWGAAGYWIAVFSLIGIYKFIGHRFTPKSLKNYANKYLVWKSDWFLFGLNRFEAIVFFFFFAYVLLACCINYSLELNAYLTTHYFLLIDLISFRTDIIGFSLMPVVYLMGIRNNPFQLLTGVSHHVMLQYHKVVAFVFFILCVVHSAIWTHYAIHIGGGYASWAADAYFYWGIVGTIVVGLMILQSFAIFRNRLYEIFLFFHNAFAVLFVVAMWLHCNTLGWMGWVYSIASILVFDRVCRIYRFFKNGLFNDVQVDIVAKDVVKLQFNKPSIFYFFPGCYVYLTFIFPNNVPWYYSFQSHPFSLLRSHEESNKMVLYLKAKRGATGQLLKINSSNIKVLIDGPYGVLPFGKNKNDDLNDKVLGIAGGLGISSILTYFNERAKSLDDMSKYKIIWYINNIQYVDILKDNLEYLIFEKNVSVDIYYTGDSGSNESEIQNCHSCEKGTDSETDSFTPKSSFNIIHSKTKIEEVLSQNSAERRKIYCCGPGSFVKELKNSLTFGDDLMCENHTW